MLCLDNIDVNHVSYFLYAIFLKLQVVMVCTRWNKICHSQSYVHAHFPFHPWYKQMLSAVSIYVAITKGCLCQLRDRTDLKN